MRQIPQNSCHNLGTLKGLNKDISPTSSNPYYRQNVRYAARDSAPKKCQAIACVYGNLLTLER